MSKNRYYQLKTQIGGAVSRYIDQLDTDGQIDVDLNSDPVVLGYENIEGSNLVRVAISRNGQRQTIVMNPKARKMQPDKQTFDGSDGWKRPQQSPQPVNTKPVNPRAERQKRPQNVSSSAGAPNQRVTQQPSAMQREAQYRTALEKLLK